MRRPSLSMRARHCAALAAALGILVAPGIAAAAVNPDADEILHAMSRYLGGIKAFSVSADVGNEIIAQDGQKLQLNSSATVLVERPSHLYISRQGKAADATLLFDGRQLTVYSKTINAYLQRDFTGTSDAALAAIESGTGLNLPATDLLLSDPYAALAPGVTASGYYGTAYVDGVECHHLAFRKANVDWQLWVKTGDEPLPMKYVITTKWVTGAPQFSVQFRNWNTRPVIAAGRFGFAAPQGAKKLEKLPVDEAGDVVAQPEDKR